MSTCPLSAVIVVLVAGACGAGGDGNEVAYELSTVDGHALPYAPMHPDRPADAPPPPVIVGGSLTMNADSTFRAVMTYGAAETGVPAAMERQFSGTYGREGQGYVFAWANAGQTPVTLRDDTLMLNSEGMLFMYLRQPQR